MTYPSPEARSCGASEAAKLFEQAGRPDFAAQCRALADALTTKDSRAYGAVGRSGDTEGALARAWELVSKVPMPATEKANVFMTLAGLCAPAPAGGPNR